MDLLRDSDILEYYMSAIFAEHESIHTSGLMRSSPHSVHENTFFSAGVCWLCGYSIKKDCAA